VRRRRRGAPISGGTRPGTASRSARTWRARLTGGISWAARRGPGAGRRRRRIRSGRWCPRRALGSAGWGGCSCAGENPSNQYLIWVYFHCSGRMLLLLFLERRSCECLVYLLKPLRQREGRPREQQQHADYEENITKARRGMHRLAFRYGTPVLQPRFLQICMYICPSKLKPPTKHAWAMCLHMHIYMVTRELYYSKTN